MREYNEISRLTIARMVLYYRELRQIQYEEASVISSEKLSLRVGVSPEQIRKDLASFGEFGKKGVGYSVDDLLQVIVEILRLRRKWRIAIVGYGHLGGALANYNNFRTSGFRLAAILDNDPAKIGKELNGIKISSFNSLNEVIKTHNIDIGIIAVPAREAQYVSDRLITAGVRGIWNFAPVRLKVPSDISLVEEDLTIGLSSLPYYISQTEPLTVNRFKQIV